VDVTVELTVDEPDVVAVDDSDVVAELV